ncbi:MAG: type II secretion system protein [Myxococcales bacterium]|nr:type II secretion system protein [Myxococcales bacterium]
MAMPNGVRKAADRRRGFHLFEIVIVLAVIGVLVALAMPRLRGVGSRQDTRNAVAAVAGVLQRAREQAIKDGVPHLVVVKPSAAGGGGGGGGSCPAGQQPAHLQVVRDNDSSYSVTPGDTVADQPIDGFDTCTVALYGESADAPPFPSLPLPQEDVGSVASTLAHTLAGGVAGLLGGGSGSNSGSGSSGSNSGSSGGSGSSSGGSGSGSTPGGSGSGSLLGGIGSTVGSTVSTVGSTVGGAISALGGSGGSGSAAGGMTHGSTLPVGDDGLPVAAFTPAGWAVEPSTPGVAGSGAGAIYVTDNERAVYAAVVQPLGRVVVRAFDASTGDWK